MYFRNIFLVGTILLAGCTATAERTVSLDNNFETKTGEKIHNNQTFALEDINKFDQSITLVLPVSNEQFTVRTGCQAGTAIVEYGPVSNLVIKDVFESLFAEVTVLEVPWEDVTDLIDYQTLPDEWAQSDVMAFGFSLIYKDKERWDETPECYFPFVASMVVTVLDNQATRTIYEEKVTKKITIDVVDMVDRAARAGTISMGLLAPVLVPQVTGASADEGAARIAEFMQKAATSLYRKMKTDTALPNNLVREARINDAAGKGDEPAYVPPADVQSDDNVAIDTDAPDPETEALIRQIEGPYAPFMDATVVIKTGTALGSGFFITPSGYIVTNHHVVDGHSRVTVETRDGGIGFGKVVASDEARDLAIVKLGRPSSKFLNLGTVNDVQLGVALFAIGSPRGLEYSISKGTLSGVRANENDVLLIQTDTALNPGNSGGPIISESTGNVVAVVSFGQRGGGDSGLNFGVSVNEIYELIEESGLTIE
ncbi:MAG: trypsin-like peptidase domain-containing protein [Alphaproteobacteria bacterium]